MRTRVKQSGGAILALVCSATAAIADGASAPAADLALTSTDWSGLYVGVQGGGAWSHTGWTFPVDSFFTVFDGNKSFNAVSSGGVMGGHVTLNHQIGSLVIGAELLVSAADVERERTGAITQEFPTDRFTTRLTNYGTLTGRLGYAHDDWLIYLSGGFAAGHISLDAVSGPPVAGVVGQVGGRINGYTLGGGGEYMIARNVAIGVQYDYIKLGGERFSAATTGTPDDTPFIVDVEDVDLMSVTARLSIKLDPLGAGP
jgi:outer membrane immunogenic protein